MKAKKSILIAEDEKQIAKFIVDAFKRLDFDVIEVQNGEETYQKAIKHIPDIILLDILMPKMNGIKVIKKLREPGSPCHKTPIVVLSAMGKLYQKREAIEAGANAYLCKPMFTEEIVDGVLGCLEKMKS